MSHSQMALSKVPDDESNLKPLYVESLTLVERLHRRMLDLVKDEFDHTNLYNVNSAQALLLFNIGESEMAASELKTRGCYLGSNVSYNLKKLTAMEYLHHERSLLDRRSARVRLTAKGREIAAIVNGLYERHIKWISGVESVLALEDIDTIRNSLRRLDRFLNDQVLYRL